MDPKLFAFYCIGSDDCKIPAKICVEALLVAWTEQVSEKLKANHIVLIQDFNDSALEEQVKAAGIDVEHLTNEAQILESAVGVAVGGIRALRAGGDSANIRLHKRFPGLEEWTKETFHGRMGEHGKAYCVRIPKQDAKPTMKFLVFVVAPNMNPRRAEYCNDERLVFGLLRDAYSAMFQEFVSSLPMEDIEGYPEAIAPASSAKRPRPDTSSSCGVEFEIKPVGLGTLPLGVLYPDSSKRPTSDTVQKMIMESLSTSSSNGLFLVDVADTYCSGKDDAHYIENVLGEILTRHAEVRSRLLIAAKYGMMRINSESTGWRLRYDMSPAFIISSLQRTLDALHMDSVFLWQLHHADQVYKKSRGLYFNILAEVSKMIRAGRVQHLGLCNCTSDILLETHKHTPNLVYSVQNEYNYWHRDAERKGVFDLCRDLNISFIAYAPFGGLKARRTERCIERAFPEIIKIAEEKSCSPGQVYLAYLLARIKRFGVKNVILIPSSRNLDRVKENQGACTLVLTESELGALDGGWQRKR